MSSTQFQPESTPHDTARSHHEQALQIIHSYVVGSAAAGLVPIPGIDVTILAGIHIALIKALTEHYGESFSEHAARNVVIAVAASVIPGTFGSIFGRKVLRYLPFGLNPIAQSAWSAGVSYALGRVIVAHFETGGTLDSLDTNNLHRLMWWREIAPPAAV